MTEKGLLYLIVFFFCLVRFPIRVFKDDVTRNESQRQLLAQHSVATLLLHCFEYAQHCSNITTLCCAKNRRCESFRVTSSLTMYFQLKRRVRGTGSA